MPRRTFGVLLLAFVAAVLLPGCLKRTREVIEFEPDGNVGGSFEATFDQDAVLRHHRGLEEATAALVGKVDPLGEITPERLREAADRRRAELASSEETKITSVECKQHAEANELTEVVSARFGSLKALLRSGVARTQENVEEARLARNADGTWTFTLRGTLGGFRLERFLEPTPQGPPRPRTQPSHERNIRFPGEVVSADLGATVKGNLVTWQLRPPVGWAALPYAHSVVFRGGESLAPFHLTARDVAPTPPPGGRFGRGVDEREDEDGPLDGAGWEPPEQRLDARWTRRVRRPERAVEGTVSIEGRVTYRGEVVPDAKVSFLLKERPGSYGDDYTVATDHSGRYRVPGLVPGTYGVEVVVGKEGTRRPDFVLEEGSGWVHDIALGTGSIEVSVLDEQDRPFQDLAVFAHSGQRQVVLSDSKPKTNASGVARVPFLDPGTYRVVAALDVRGGTWKDVQVPEGSEPTRVVLHPTGSSRIVVQVLDADRRPSPAYIRLMHPGGIPHIGQYTDATGRSVFHVRPDEWIVGLDSVPHRCNHETRFLKFARRITTRSGSVSSVILVKPRPM